MRYALLAGILAVLAVGHSRAASAQAQAQAAPAPAPGTPGVTLQLTNPRPRLGVAVDIRRRDTDSLGAFIEEVRAGSPAARAGIRAGDIITKLDGQPTSSPGDPRPSGLRLLSLAARLSPNDTVAVELRRGKTKKTVAVVTPPEMALVIQGAPNDSGKRWSISIQPGDSSMAGLARYFVWVASPLAALQTVPLNDDLGAYFGTTEGVLVVSRPSDGSVGLRGGDVILAVNGQKPTDPGHLTRLLQAHTPSEPIRLTVLRHRKRVRVTVRLNSGDNP